MEESFLGEIKIFAGNFAPKGWRFCDGSILPVAGNESLFDLLGDTYGGNGVSSFALPDLRSRVAIHVGDRYPLGEMGGIETVTLTSTTIPAHTHAANAFNETAAGGLTSEPTNAFWAGNSKIPQFIAGSETGDTVMSLQAIGGTGGNAPHDNMLPFLALDFIICVNGTVPPRG
ncbi:MAG: phage tail protein [Acidobacteria bacterium]|nr:phage tail protein [Acidobacteriota bacterium]